MSTTITSLTPVLVTQPYMAVLSSSACRSPKSCPTVFAGIRASKISKHELSMKEYSSLFRSDSYPGPDAANNEM